MSEERSILRRRLGYLSSQQTQALAGGWQDTTFRIQAYDGEWSRDYWGQGSSENPSGFGVVLRRGKLSGARGIPGHRPHALILHNLWNIGSLADQLAASPEHASLRFRYGGAAEVDGHPCVEILADLPQPNGGVNQAFVLYLATDRNQIPIRVEYHARQHDQWPNLTSMWRCGDFREIATGLWYPSHLSAFSFDPWAMVGQGWILLGWRRETTIGAAASAPGIGDAAFHDVKVPAGAVVTVADESGQSIAQVHQPEDGVPWLPLKRYLELSSEAHVHPQVRQAAPEGPRRPDRPARARVPPRGDVAGRPADDPGIPARSGPDSQLLGRVGRGLSRRPRAAQ